MKCVCGYEYVEDKDGNYDITKGNYPFKPLILKTNYFYDENYDVDVFACPKCGTIKIGI